MVVILIFLSRIIINSKYTQIYANDFHSDHQKFVFVVEGERRDFSPFANKHASSGEFALFGKKKLFVRSH